MGKAIQATTLQRHERCRIQKQGVVKQKSAAPGSSAQSRKRAPPAPIVDCIEGESLCDHAVAQALVTEEFIEDNDPADRLAAVRYNDQSQGFVIQKTAAPGSSARRRKKHASAPVVDCIVGNMLSDNTVAQALATILKISDGRVRKMMEQWQKPILKVPIPGIGGHVPTPAMLAEAKAAVVQFLDHEETLGPRSHVAKAFHLASRESSLHFAWDWARQRVRRAKLDSLGKIDSWKDCLAMVSGDSNTKSEIYVCGTRRVTMAALKSLICHECLHNLARRTRRGNPFLGEDMEHIAMALIGDPQLAA